MNTTKTTSVDLIVGDVFWFSGYWVTVVRFEGDKIIGRWNTPNSRPEGTWMLNRSWDVEVTKRVS